MTTRGFGFLALSLSFQVNAQAQVDLELRAPAQDVVAGMTFEVALYAVANPGPTQNVGDVRAIMSWDNSVLSFNGIHIDDGHNWQQSGFFGDPDGINDDVTDGIAMYRATAGPGDLGLADTNGLLVTKFEFTALVITSPGTTAVDILASAGATPTTTRALDDVTGGSDVTGTLIGDTLMVIACSVDPDCDDADYCTNQACSGDVCSYTLTYTPGVECCNPGNGFTQPIDDENDCTTDICNPDGSITHNNRQFGTLCGQPDEFPCSFQDTCDAGGNCLPNHATNGAFCNDDDNDCTADHCQDGVCVLDSIEPDGVGCNDGLDYCTPGQDICQGGLCFPTSDFCAGDPVGPFCEEVGGEAVCRECRLGEDDCPTTGCLRGACLVPGVCFAIPDDSLCSDGEYCNGIETCDAMTGLCDPDPDPQLCINPDFPYCDETTDTCEVCLVDADCDNGLACDGVETCDPGVAPHVCNPGTPVQCPPLEACARYECQEPDGSCVATPINEGLLICDDGDACTARDMCVGGMCAGGPTTGLGGVSLEFRLPPGAPTIYDLTETVEVDLFAVLNDAIKSCPLSAIVCDSDADCTTGECVFPTSRVFRVIETVLNWDPGALDINTYIYIPPSETGCDPIDAPEVLDPCNECDSCRILCATDDDCDIDVPFEDDCLCPATGAPPPCPPDTGAAVCRHLLVVYPDECPATPDVNLCGATCPPGQHDWGSVWFPTNCPGSFDPNDINVSYDDGDGYVEIRLPLIGGSLPVVTTTQDIWVARFQFTVVGGQGRQPAITFGGCTPEGAIAPSLTRVLGYYSDMVTGDLTDVSVTVRGCSAPLCDDGSFCNGAETCVSQDCDYQEGDPNGCCVPGYPPCVDGDECTTDQCSEADDTCSYPPNYDPETDCCDPDTGGLTSLDDGNMCTEGICDPATGIVAPNPLPNGTPCDDDEVCTEADRCDGAGTCRGDTLPGCIPCETDGQCDDFVACTVNTCIDLACEFIPDDSLCADNGLYCDGPEICDLLDGCFSTGSPCPGSCSEAGNPQCPCEAPDVSGAGSRYIAIRPGPINSPVPVKLRVDWPAGDSPCFSRYVGSLLCGGDPDEPCTGDADCNECSFTRLPCLGDEDCDAGLCDSGQECSVNGQNCIDQTECLRREFCMISGDLCDVSPLVAIDINNDGFMDGTAGVLVGEAGATALTPAEWSRGLMRCTKSAAPCEIDSDCPRGRCATTGTFCVIPSLPCFDGAECVRDEICRPAPVYVYGDDIVPSEYGPASEIPEGVPNAYDVIAECGMAQPIPPATVVMWRWADTNNDAYVNITDIQLIQLAIQGVYLGSTVITNDLAGTRDVCWVQQWLNAGDIGAALRALQVHQPYFENVCNHPTCP